MTRESHIPHRASCTLCLRCPFTRSSSPPVSVRAIVVSLNVHSDGPTAAATAKAKFIENVKSGNDRAELAAGEGLIADVRSKFWAKTS